MLIDTPNITLNLSKPLIVWIRPARIFKHWWQRLTRGFDDSETWSLDQTLATYIVPRMKRFRDVTISFPADHDSLEHWVETLDQIIEGFELIADDPTTFDRTPEQNAKIEQSLDLFRQYFFHLWD